MAMKANTVFVGTNFKFEGTEDFPSNPAFLERADVFYDERCRFITTFLNTDNWDWYYNYIDFLHTVSVRNTDAKPSYLLNLGYVPVIMLPSCCLRYSTSLFEALDNSGVPYIRVPAMSFVTSHCNVETVDAWVSKMDACKVLNCKPEEVTSIDVFRRLILGE